MKCKHITIRMQNKARFFFCRLKRIQIQLDLKQCETCQEFKYKKYHTIKKKSKKLIKLEKNRYSIITNDLKHCYICTERGKANIPKQDLHEVYGGKNRKISIENGLVVPLCRQCHIDYEVLKWLKKFVQLEYEETHSREEFINLIGKSYL